VSTLIAHRLESVADLFAEDRRASLERLWLRFCECSLAAGVPLPRFDSARGRAQIMRIALDRGMPPGWRLGSVLEAADLGLDLKTLPLAKPQPTTARAGSPAKLRVLASRAAAGQELWHPEDGPGVILPRSRRRPPRSANLQGG